MEGREGEWMSYLLRTEWQSTLTERRVTWMRNGKAKAIVYPQIEFNSRSFTVWMRVCVHVCMFVCVCVRTHSGGLWIWISIKTLLPQQFQRWNENETTLHINKDAMHFYDSSCRERRRKRVQVCDANIFVDKCVNITKHANHNGKWLWPMAATGNRRAFNYHVRAACGTIEMPLLISKEMYIFYDKTIKRLRFKYFSLPYRWLLFA